MEDKKGKERGEYKLKEKDLEKLLIFLKEENKKKSKGDVREN